MYYFIRICCISLLINMYGCKTTNQPSSQTISNTMDVKQEEKSKQGFIKGEISISKSSSGCSYILTTEKYQDKLDPINFDDYVSTIGTGKVWVKYSDLRMASRCNEARPVSITEISKR